MNNNAKTLRKYGFGTDYIIHCAESYILMGIMY